MPPKQNRLTLYLKAPYLRQIRKRITPYVLRIEPDLVQLKGSLIDLADGHRTISVLIKDATRVPVDTLDIKILKSMGFRNTLSVRVLLQSIYDVDSIDEITLLEVIVQPKERKLGFKRALYSKFGIKLDVKP